MEAYGEMTTPYSESEFEQAVKILKEDALLAGHRAVAERLDRMEQRLSRLPVTEMTPEEKAAAYDKLIAERNQASAEPAKKEPSQSDSPAAPPQKPDPEPKAPRVDKWFGVEV
jgi:hypothetical protein